MGWFKKSPEDKIRAERDRQAAKLRRNKAEGAFLKAREEAAIKMKAREGAEYYSKPHGFAGIISGFAKIGGGGRVPSPVKTTPVKYKTNYKYIKKGKSYVRKTVRRQARAIIKQPVQQPQGNVFGGSGMNMGFKSPSLWGN